ncbi:MAG: NAD(P)/FAD-dependent oxidoreductase [Sulfolobaceae archaeon]|nr:NAD(P)/FAD-dependent oxidoreductase [Sulfolobaceae archaeon]
MKIIIGAGFTGLFIANRLKESTILIEEQPDVGGVYLTDELNGYRLPLTPPLTDEQSLENFGFELEEIKLNQVYEKVEHLKEKVCISTNCEIPSWLKLLEKDKIYIIKNVPEVLDTLKKNQKIIRGYPIKITSNNYIITNRGSSFNFDKLIYTGSLIRLLGILGKKNPGLDYISAHISVLLTNKKETNWNVIINGRKGISYSYIFKMDKVDVSIFYVLSFFKGSKVPELKRVLIDLKRTKTLYPNEILAFRTMIIKEAILIGEGTPSLDIQDNIVVCGRLGKWKNFSLYESFNEALNC